MKNFFDDSDLKFQPLLVNSRLRGRQNPQGVSRFPRIFQNVSNFEELYLRAQWIFFDGTGTIAKIYV